VRRCERCGEANEAVYYLPYRGKENAIICPLCRSKIPPIWPRLVSDD
jgi:hypothetical protein